eukprot:TRINITY_DN26891_c0_g1_i1.p1 TRINITY_DN26891_c0_g1~~TRINITY_DN26891_c0_g1_i1.p1  ORF type:complete len:167 (-),score=34.84 TRINITY_DN26891_c0_g1_i1:131-631(-)
MAYDPDGPAFFAALFIAVVLVLGLFKGAAMAKNAAMRIPSRSSSDTENISRQVGHDDFGNQLLAAAAAGREDSCEELLAAKPELVNFCDYEGRTPLIFAAAGGHTAACLTLLKARAEVDATDRHGKTPLAYAAGPRHVEACRVLLDYGAEIEATDCIVRDMGCSLL